MQSGSVLADLDLLGLTSGSDNASDNSSVRAHLSVVSACRSHGRPCLQAASLTLAGWLRPFQGPPTYFPLHLPSHPPPPQVRNGLCNSLLIDPADMAVEDVMALHGAQQVSKASAWPVG